MDVQQFIISEMERDYPGACCRMADNWFRANMGFSALENYGRTFQTEKEVQDWIAEFGGIAVAVNRVMRKSGARKTGIPQIGDIGLVFVPVHRLCLAIHAGDVWVSRDENGMIGAPLAAVWKAWRMPCRA